MRHLLCVLVLSFCCVCGCVLATTGGEATGVGGASLQTRDEGPHSEDAEEETLETCGAEGKGTGKPCKQKSPLESSQERSLIGNQSDDHSRSTPDPNSEIPSHGTTSTPTGSSSGSPGDQGGSLVENRENPSPLKGQKKEEDDEGSRGVEEQVSRGQGAVEGGRGHSDSKPPTVSPGNSENPNGTDNEQTPGNEQRSQINNGTQGTSAAQGNTNAQEATVTQPSSSSDTSSSSVTENTGGTTSESDDTGSQNESTNITDVTGNTTTTTTTTLPPELTNNKKGDADSSS
ncbi:uncharacterized protein TM35_000511450, partial [Trypanosoma theileri]